MKIKMLMFLSLVLLSGCQSLKTVYFSPHKLLVTGNTLVYDGPINGDAVLEALRVIRNSGKDISKIKITSTGGDMASGIEFGYFIYENNLDVEVTELCFSSCANYILPAAKNVVINSNSMVSWHGGAKQSDELWVLSVPKKERVEFQKMLDRLRIKETAFFGVIGVDQKITTYGQTIKNSCQIKEKTDGWHYSIEDLNRMGIKNIKVIGSGLLSEVEYKDDSGQMDTVNFKGDKITSCLLKNVFVNSASDVT